MCILRKWRSKANTTQSQKWQTTKMFPVPNPNHPTSGPYVGSPAISGAAGHPCSGYAGGPTPVAGDQAQAGGAGQTWANAKRPPPATGAGAAAPRGGEDTRPAGPLPTSASPSRPRAQPRPQPAGPGSPRPGGQRRAPGPAGPAGRQTPAAAQSSLAAARGGPGAARHHPPRRAGGGVGLRGAQARTRGQSGSRRGDTDSSPGPAAVVSG